MNLTQRAKKKLVGSFSKRKKLKISGEDVDIAPPLPRSRPPLPALMTPLVEPSGQLYTSISVPAHLDKSRDADPTWSFSNSTWTSNTKVSEQATWNVHESGSAEADSLHYLTSAAYPHITGGVSTGHPHITGGVSTGYPHATSRLNCDSQAGDETCNRQHSPRGEPLLHPHTPLAHVSSNGTQTRVESSVWTHELPPAHLAPSQPSVATSYTTSPADSQQIFNPRSSPSLGVGWTDGGVSMDSGVADSEEMDSGMVNSDQFVSSLFSDIIDTSTEGEETEGESTKVKDDDRILTQDVGIFEVFDSLHHPDSHSLTRPDPLSLTRDPGAHLESSSNLTTSSDDEENGPLVPEVVDSRSRNGMKKRTDKHIEDPVSKSRDSWLLPIIPRMDSTVLKKIQFFESYSGQGGKSAQDTRESEFKPTSAYKRSFSDTQAPPAGPPSYQHPTRQLSLWTNARLEESPESSRKVQKLSTSTPRLRVAVTSEVEVSRTRLNFSKFRRSVSIPETVVCCNQTECEGECASRCHVTKDGGLEVQSRGGLGDLSMPGKLTTCQVCHHPLCTEDNNDLPLLLCQQCDLELHRQPEYSGHLVLDKSQKRGVAPREPPGGGDYDCESDSDGQQTVTDDNVDGLFVKHNYKSRTKSPSSEIERKLKRKKALKKKISNGSRPDGLDAALAQLADPEGTDTALLYTMDGETTDSRSTEELLGRQDSGLGDPVISGVHRQESQEMAGSEGDTATLRLPVRRQSRVPINEGYFTVKFSVREGEREELEVVAAVNNMTLRESLEPVLDRRNLDINCVNVFIEKSRTPLPLASDTVFLAGNTLEVKEKDEHDLEPESQGKPGRPAKVKSGGGKGNKQAGGSLRGRRATNLSIDDSNPPPSPVGTWTEGKKSKSPKLSVVNLFTTANKDREKQEQLTEILNRYSNNGLPPLPELLALGRPTFDDVMLEMEGHWKDFVYNHKAMTRKQQEKQEAIWELLHTEVSYIKQIRVIIDVFQNCLINVQQEAFLNEIETERLFSNMDKVLECNQAFWQQYLLPVLRQARSTRQPVDPVFFKEGFVDHFPNLFQVYFKYVIEHKSCLEYAKQCMDIDLFKTFINWAEAQKQCNRLKMADILVKPMQRLLKYSLLLSAILKHSERDEEREAIREMIESVDKMCVAANNSLQRREDYEKLEAIRKTIDLYDAIEAPNDECSKIISEYSSNFNLLAPMPGFREGQPRSLLFQSSLRMKEAQNIKKKAKM